MRKMISTKKAKVLDNLAVNDNGTIIEVGGNIALESIEQLGTMQDVNITSFLKPASSESTFGSLATGCSDFEPVGSWNNGNIPPIDSYCNNAGDVGFINLGGSIYYIYNDGTKHYKNNYSDAQEVVLKARGGTIHPAAPTRFYRQEAVKSFKPFFTQEQYEAILDLIS